MTLLCDRHLVEVDLRAIPAYRFDVVIVGGGVAGDAAALSAVSEGKSVAIVTKSDLNNSNTNWAQGGMAAVMTEGDSFASHIRDTIEVGVGLCDEELVRKVIEGGPDAVNRLMYLGAEFDTTDSGILDCSREGGHKHARVVHAHGDATGREIQRVLTNAVTGHDLVTTFPNTFALDIVTADGVAYGVVARDASGKLVLFSSNQIILATGGGGQLYRETTNPTIATADGVAMAFRAGAVIRDPEFFQFHPTCLYIAGAARVLISEIVRGHGGVLRNKMGDRFMDESHPDAELAPRDVVSRAVFRQMIETNDTNVYLDLSCVDGDPHRLFPGISKMCGFFGIDIAKDPVPVRPGAHYMIGGVQVDHDGRTSIPGVWAVGECASSGLHGANRMGSNSLLEGMVLGETAGRNAALLSKSTKRPRPSRILRRELDDAPHGIELGISDLIYSMKSLMWRQVGLERNEEQLSEAHGHLSFWFDAVRKLAPAEPRAWELVNMLTVANLAALGARDRKESRGVHYRTDFVHEGTPQHTIITPIETEHHCIESEIRHIGIGERLTYS
ncbi:MAG: L-aspartate oxidase [Phycisphaerae bacterium]|jgi:L-aspartate oxidase|nr:L-aspartate oxidase [Phycisphaerae bacterium]MBT6164676.1 L-aspartate oxidase [Phycisphaerae bacterium]MBT7657272.1 L-aspartate oxidase [Phycisphaerae bacterium]